MYAVIAACEEVIAAKRIDTFLGFSLKALKGNFIPSIAAFRNKTKGFALFIRKPPLAKLRVTSIESAAAFLATGMAAISSGVNLFSHPFPSALSSSLLKRTLLGACSAISPKVDIPPKDLRESFNTSVSAFLPIGLPS